MERLLFLLLGYACGLIQTGYFVSKMLGVDLSSQGSGNTGATNSLRVMGKKWGAVVFFGDFFKSLIPCLLARMFAGDAQLAYVYMMYAGLGAVLGHIYPFYLKFKGGKGVACTAGILVALDWRITLLALFVFVLTVALSRYVSLASILVMLVFVIFAFILSGEGAGGYRLAYSLRGEFMALVIGIALISIWKHRSNIARLLQGKENKIFTRR